MHPKLRKHPASHGLEDPLHSRTVIGELNNSVLSRGENSMKVFECDRSVKKKQNDIALDGDAIL